MLKIINNLKYIWHCKVDLSYLIIIIIIINQSKQIETYLSTGSQVLTVSSYLIQVSFIIWHKIITSFEHFRRKV